MEVLDYILGKDKHILFIFALIAFIGTLLDAVISTSERKWIASQADRFHRFIAQTRSSDFFIRESILWSKSLLSLAGNKFLSMRRALFCSSVYLLIISISFICIEIGRYRAGLDIIWPFTGAHWYTGFPAGIFSIVMFVALNVFFCKFLIRFLYTTQSYMQIKTISLCALFFVFSLSALISIDNIWGIVGEYFITSLSLLISEVKSAAGDQIPTREMEMAREKLLLLRLSYVDFLYDFGIMRSIPGVDVFFYYDTEFGPVKVSLPKWTDAFLDAAKVHIMYPLYLMRDFEFTSQVVFSLIQQRIAKYNFIGSSFQDSTESIIFGAHYTFLLVSLLHWARLIFILFFIVSFFVVNYTGSLSHCLLGRLIENGKTEKIFHIFAGVTFILYRAIDLAL